VEVGGGWWVPAAPPRTFYNVDRRRERSTPDLRRETVLLLGREGLGNPVDGECEFMALTPGMKFLVRGHLRGTYGEPESEQ